MIHNLVFHPPFHLLEFAPYHLWLHTVLVMFLTSAPLYLIRFVLFPSSFTPPLTFYLDVLFDDTKAVDAAWTKLAHNLGKDPAKVTSASHGKSVTDAMTQLRPFITRRRLEFEVAKFEESILDFADTPSHLKSMNSTPIIILPGDHPLLLAQMILPHPHQHRIIRHPIPAGPRYHRFPRHLYVMVHLPPLLLLGALVTMVDFRQYARHVGILTDTKLHPYSNWPYPASARLAERYRWAK
ncbi:hypothetical protein D9758_002481 [Tetrapyrgos nigripes]|uniref:Uncharacterized protein n=1 Tax=Tetrapyrgos nigripes TaxID=182062 RepID=A0A8H5GQL6_9AGAR|nr:hypothetical protein D9758_002481 [Tetrapyrgos nigripes]